MADIVFMTDYSAWKISISTILFLIGCAWHNRFVGYRKLVNANVNTKKVPVSAKPSGSDAVPADAPAFLVPDTYTREISLIWNTPRSGPVFSDPAHAYTRQLVNLNLALHSVPVPTPPETGKSVEA